VCVCVCVQARLACADLGGIDLGSAGVLMPGEKFDIVSIQFALHYMFDTKVCGADALWVGACVVAACVLLLVLLLWWWC